MLIVYKFKRELPIGLIIQFLLERLEQVLDAVRGECRLAKDTHDLKYGSANLEFMFDDCNEAVCDDGDMYLDSYRIFRLTPESFDLEMLLDPFEEQFHLPSVFIKKCDFPRFEIEVVRVVDEASVQLWSIIDDTSDDTRILFLVRILGEADSLVFEHVVRPVKDAFAIDNFVLRLALLPDDEEGSEYMDAIESCKVKVASVKDIAGKRLVCEPVHRVDIMHLGIGDSVEDGDLRDNVNLSMDTDARLCTSELGPSEYCHAEVNGRRIDCVEPAVQLKLFRDALALSNRHHVEGKLLKDTMVSERIRSGQYLPVDWLTAKAEVFGFSTMSNREICKFPEASTAHQLAKHQIQHMIPMRHRPVCGSVVVPGNDTSELPLRKELYYLCKNELSNMHIYSDLKSYAKIRISKPGQGIGELKRCA